MPHDDDVPGKLTAAYAYALEGDHRCYRCGKDTRVFSVMAVGPFAVEGDVYAADDDASLVVRSIAAMPPAMMTMLAKLSNGHFRPDYSSTAGEGYWMNHCAHCGAKIGDWFVHKPGEVFFPTSIEDMAGTRGHRVDGPIEFHDPQVSHSGWTDEWLAHIEGRPLPVPPASAAASRKRRLKK